MDVLSNLKNQHALITPTTKLLNACEYLGPGASLQPRIRAGRMHFVPGKIKYSSSMYKGIKWLLSSIETPTSVIFSKRITEELTNILENTGATISLKRAYIKELRMARLNVRRKRYFNKWLRIKKWKKTKKWKKKKNKYGIQIRYRG